MHILAQSLI